MSVIQMAHVWKHQFSPPEQLIMLALADHADDDGNGIYPSIDHIAWKTGYCRTTIKNLLSRLRARGILRVVRNHSPSRPTEYAFDWAKAAVKSTAEQPEGVRSGDSKVTPRDPQGVRSGDSKVTPRDPEPSLNHQLTINKPSTPPLPPQIDPPGFYEYVSPNGDARSPKPGGKRRESQKPPDRSEATSTSLELACAEQPTEAEIIAPRTEKLSRRGAAIDYGELVAAWNEHCGVLPRVMTLSAERRRKLKRLVDEHGYHEALALLLDATRQVASDDFWAERGYGLDNLLRPGRVVEKAEKYRASPIPLGAGERRMAMTAARIANAIGGWK